MWLYLFIFLNVNSLFSSELTFNTEEVLRINQRIVSPLILDDFPEAVTVSYVLENIEADKTVLSKLKVIDLANTHMDADDFTRFFEGTRESLPSLQVLRLCTVNFSSDFLKSCLLPRLGTEHFQYVDLTSTLYSNSSIQKLLTLGSELYGEEWLPISEKIIFSAQKSLPTLSSGSVKWVTECVDTKKILSPQWKKCHDDYYSKVLKAIEKISPRHFIAGLDDVSELGDE